MMRRGEQHASAYLAAVAIVVAVGLTAAAAWMVHEQGLTSCRRSFTPHASVFWLLGGAGIALGGAVAGLSRATDRVVICRMGLIGIAACATVAVFIGFGDPGGFFHQQNYRQRCYPIATE